MDSPENLPPQHLVNKEHFKIEVPEDQAGVRLDLFVPRRFETVSRAAIKRLIGRGVVRVNGRKAAKGDRLRAGDQVELPGWAVDERPLAQPELELVVLAEQPDLVVINKPPGPASHPLLPGETGTVANALLARHPECADASTAAREGGLVHRLDACTSGVLLAARTPDAYRALRDEFRQHLVIKEYLALVDARVDTPGGVEAGIRTGPKTPGKVALEDPVFALTGPHDLPPIGSATPATAYTPERDVGRFTLVRARCHTGARHQVRAHLAHCGLPLVGDTLYGGPRLPGFDGVWLHAARITLPHDRTFEAPLPTSRKQTLEQLETMTPK